MRVNRAIRASRVRLIGANGEQVGVVTLYDALAMADEAGMDLVEISPNAEPPVCKIISYGKYRYDQTKREKENKKSQHQIKVKEVKVKPNIDDNDLATKLKHAREFLEKGCKVKVTCTFRGREMAHQDLGVKIIQRVCEALQDLAQVEVSPKMFGRMLTLVLAPGIKKKQPVKMGEVGKSGEAPRPVTTASKPVMGDDETGSVVRGEGEFRPFQEQLKM